MKFTVMLLFFLNPLFAFGQADSHESPSQVRQISFADLKRMISEKNENVKASRVMIESSQARTGHLARSFLPQVSASVGEESLKVTSQPDQNERFWRIGAHVNLYRGGRDKIEEQIRKDGVEASRIESGRDSAFELKKAQDAYWNILVQSKLLAYREEELKQNEENIRSASRRAGAGVSTNADKVQFELNRADLEQAIETLRLELDFAKSQLALVLGLDQHDGIQVKDDFPQVTKDLPKGLGVEKRLVVRSAQVREELEKNRSRAASRWWQPNLDVYANYGVPALADEYERAIRQDRESVMGLRLSFDFGQGLDGRSEAKSKALEAKAFKHKLAFTVREAEAEEHKIEHYLITTAKMVAHAEKNLEKARSFLSLTKSEYQRGVKNGPDLMAASRQYFELVERRILLTRQYLEHRSAFEALYASSGAVN